MGDVYAKAASYGRFLRQYYGAIGPIVKTQMVFVLAARGLRPLASVGPQTALDATGPIVKLRLFIQQPHNCDIHECCLI